MKLKEKPKSKKGSFFSNFFFKKDKPLKPIVKLEDQEKQDTSYTLIETYWIHNPLAKVNIVSSGGELKYIAEEVKLSSREEKSYKQIESHNEGTFTARGSDHRN